jgi:hypothetical protein
MPHRSSTARPLSASEAVALMRRETADTLRTSLEQCIGTRAERAASLDCSAGRLAQMLDASDEATICVARASLLPDAARVAIAQLVAGERFVVAELPALDDTRSAFADLARAVRETGEATAAHADALADGVITAAEARNVRKEIREAQAALARLDALAADAEREGVIGVVTPIRQVAR